MYYTILYYTILYYTILYYTILYYTILYYTILYYTVLYCTVLAIQYCSVLTIQYCKCYDLSPWHTLYYFNFLNNQVYYYKSIEKEKRFVDVFTLGRNVYIDPFREYSENSPSYIYFCQAKSMIPVDRYSIHSTSENVLHNTS